MVFAVGAAGPDPLPVVQREPLPDGATAWTPSADRCLSPGQYAWTVRVLVPGDTPQAEPRLFIVRPDVNDELRVLREELARLTRRDPVSSSETAPEPATPASESTTTASITTESMKWLGGDVFAPPACAPPDIFSDVSASNPLCPWIEQAYNDGLTQGCGGGKYCPQNPVNRQQLAVFLGKVRHADAGGDLTGSYPSPTLATSVRLPQGCGNSATAIWNGSVWTCGSPNSVPIPFHVQANGGLWGELAGPGIGGTGDTGVTGWGNTGMFGYGNGTGVWGETGLSSGVGVRGNAWAGGLGVYGYSGGSNFGVLGESVSGRGISGYVSATTGATYGVWGQTESSLGIGVYGRSSTASGFTNGFVGPTGVWGDSGSGVGVFGTSLSNVAVSGYSGGALAIRGQSTASGGTAIRGEATASSGTNVGLHGKALSGLGSVGVHGEGYFAGIQGEGEFYGGYFNSPSTGAYFAGQGNYGIIVFGGAGNCSGCSSSGGLTRATIAELRAAGRLPEKAIIATNAGAFLSGGGTWVNSSDARLKENFERIDRSDLLAHVVQLPIRSWNYIADGTQVRHIGPTAQDFQAAFGLGGGDTTISTIDPAGIALAAIQELAERTAELQREVEALRSENMKLTRIIAGER